MKQRRVIPLIIGGLLILAACGGQTDGDITYTAEELARQVWDSQPGLATMNTLAYGDDDFADYIAYNYGLDVGSLADGAVCYPDGASALEVAVLRPQDSADSSDIAQLLRDYIEHRIDVFYGYMPDQVALLEQAVVEVRSPYIALLICGDPSGAQELLTENLRTPVALGGSEPATTPLSAAAPTRSGIQAGYNAEAVLEAYRTGDASRLSSKNRQILQICEYAIKTFTDDDMSDYEKELAIHDWILEQGEYDQEANNRARSASPHPDNGNPYGLLVAGRAICTGYSSTFQLLMDMMDIACITVPGTSRGGTVEHAWNMVRLDDEWYCVDVTWNDPVGTVTFTEEQKHAYFNITSDEMRRTGHSWNADNVPEATATTYSYKPTHSL